MLISIILVGDFAKGEFERSLTSVLNQSDSDYEIIICADIPAGSGEASDYYQNIFWENNKISSLILNKEPIGLSTNWNNAINRCKGEFVIFINSGDTLDVNFVASIKETINKNSDKLDLIEFTANLTGLSREQSKAYIEKDKPYNLKNNFSPFAYTNDFLFNKCFRREIITENMFKFKPFADYQMFFIYKFLSAANIYIHLDTKEIGFVDIQIVVSNHSVFDRVKQWTHILNYFRRIGRFKELKDYLIYAYIKLLTDTWISEIKLTKNKRLMQKAYEYLNRKFGSKRKTDFVKFNKAFKESRDEKFKSIILNYDNYLEDFRKVV